MSKKTALVLEGGGMRGAYTAGCLSWLIDEGIEFDAAYGISTGAVHLTSFLMKNKDYLYDRSTDVIADDTVVGIKPLLREGSIVGYDYLFEHHLKEGFGFDIADIRDKTGCKAKYGAYSLEEGKTVYIPIKDMDMDMLKACCTLPIIGHVVKINGKEYLDGGITKMIPVEEAVNDGCTDCLIITTKPYDYVRKPAKEIVVKLMAMIYRKCPNISRDYRERHINYEKQISLIKEMEAKGHVIYRYPTEKVNVSRLKGDKADLRKLYELGRSDMEANKEAIYKLVRK